MPCDFSSGRISRLSSLRNLDGGIEEIKQEISRNGAVLGLYYSYALYYNDGVNERKDSSYYMPYPVRIRNHAISIVEWDDDFPADAFVNNFKRIGDGDQLQEMPLPNGAWLVKNSWGKRAYKSPDEASGYYWISYYDQSLSDFTAISFEKEENGPENGQVVETGDITEK